MRGLYLNTFRGEPAISGFAWHFTATHRSSQPFVTDSGSGLHVRVPPASPCPWVDHPVSGLLHATRRPLRLGFPPAPPVRRLSLATCNNSLAHSTKGTPSHPHRDAPTGRTHTVSGSVSLPSAGCFSPFPHGTGALSVGWVFSLGPWAALLPTGFLVSGGTHVHVARPISRFRLRDSHPLRSPVPAAFACRKICSSARNLPIPPNITFNPILASAAACPASMVWAPPGSLAATTGILSVPRGTEMFQFPRFPLRCRSPALRRGVAPFGDRRITGYQPLPDAFRRVVTSFVGPARPGIHHVRFSRTDPPMSPGAIGQLRGARGDPPSMSGSPHVCSARACGARPRLSTSIPIRGAAGTRTPDLRRAKAALSRLSYGPHRQECLPPLWARLDSNQGPRPYQGRALTT